MNRTPFTFGYKLGEPADGKYKCPVCNHFSLLIDTSTSDDIGFSCSNNCTRGEILKSLGVDPAAIVHTVGSPILTALPELKQEKPEATKQAPKERITWETLFGEMAVRGWSVNFNVISQEIEVDAETDAGRLMSMDDLVTVLHSNLAGVYKGCTLDTLHAYTAYIAREYSYNPVLDFLAQNAWDGKDRTQELFDLMGIPADDLLSRTLVYKWLKQTVSLLYNDEKAPYGADGVLVLNGGQGVGKTSLFRRLALHPQWFREGATIKDSDKDTTRRCVTAWITELGEVEATLKSDISALKAFITSDMDVYRPPYARSDRKVARRTSMCATCNSDRYLIDPTGNRRWWSVPMSQPMNYDDIQKFDAVQLWAQINALVEGMTQEERAACYRLTRSEQDQLAVRNGEFEKPLKGELECRDILEQARDQDLTFTYMTITEWRSENIDALRQYSANQIGEALRHMGIEMKRKRVNGGSSASKVYLLPTRVRTPAEIRAIK